MQAYDISRPTATPVPGGLPAAYAGPDCSAARLPGHPVPFPGTGTPTFALREPTFVIRERHPAPPAS